MSDNQGVLVTNKSLSEIKGKKNQSDSAEARLRRNLFHTEYNPELRPVLNRSEKVTVKLGVSLHQIINLVRVLILELSFHGLQGL